MISGSERGPRLTRQRPAFLDGVFLLTTVVPTVAGVALIVWILSLVNWSFVGTLDFAVLYKYRFALLQGLANTLLITFLAVAFGLVFGFFLAACQYVPIAPLRWLISAYIEVLRNTPIVVQLFWIHFALPELTGFSTSALQSGCIAMSLQSSAYLADLARGGISAVPRGQWDAADALGLSLSVKWVSVILPQAIRIIIPPLANISIGLFKLSATLALLSVGELMTMASRVATFSFKPIETFTVAGIVYLTIGYLAGVVTFKLEKIFKRPSA